MWSVTESLRDGYLGKLPSPRPLQSSGAGLHFRGSLAPLLCFWGGPLSNGGRVTKDWNVLVTAQERHFQKALAALDKFGSASATDFYDVIALRVEDVPGFLAQLRQAYEKDPEFAALFGRFAPVTRRFTFQSPAEFESKAVETARTWLERLHGKRFHVRMHRRGFKGRLQSQKEEQFLDRFLRESLEQVDVLAEIEFEDPDFIIDVETLGQEAGMAIWSREELRSYPFLKLD
jgi:tRNA(Ser,Leu) C12 N-acetylase TAN1